VTTPASLRPARPRDDLPSVARLLTLSDNVVAIALTLLVFQLKVPATAQVHDPDSAADLAAQLAKRADQLISYLIAFYVVAQFWLAHHRFLWVALVLGAVLLVRSLTGTPARRERPSGRPRRHHRYRDDDQARQ